MNKLYMHLGTPKTATTAIQHFLYDNRDRLQALGYDFPDTRYDFRKDRGYAQLNNDESAYANGNVIMDACALTAYRQGPEAFEEILDYVFPDIAEYYREVIGGNETDFDVLVDYIGERLRRRHVIISSENLWTFKYDFLRRLVQEFGDAVEVVIYLRRQDKYLESMWNEVVKLGVVSDTVEDYLFFVISEANDNHGIRYKSRLQKLCRIVGKDHITIRLYEDGSFSHCGGIHQDFLRVIGIEPEKHEWVKPRLNVNDRLRGPVVNIKRLFNEYLNQKVDSKGKILDPQTDHISRFNQIFYRLSSDYIKTLPEKDLYISSSYRMRMERLFAEDNAYIAQEFLGKKPGEPLFEDDDWSREQTVEPLSMNEETMLRMIFEMGYEMNKDKFERGTNQ